MCCVIQGIDWLIKLGKAQLFKVFKRPRTYIAFVAVLAIVVLIQVAIYADGAKYMDFVLKDVKDTIKVRLLY